MPSKKVEAIRIISNHIKKMDFKIKLIIVFICINQFGYKFSDTMSRNFLRYFFDRTFSKLSINESFDD